MEKKELVKQIINNYKSQLLGPVDFFISPDIPHRKSINASLSHRLGPNEEIYVLKDNTVFGSATESMLLTDIGVSIVLNDSLPPQKISWGEIEKVEFVNNEYYFLLSRYYTSKGKRLPQLTFQKLIYSTFGSTYK